MPKKRPKPRKPGRTPLRVVRSPTSELAALRVAFHAWAVSEISAADLTHLWEDVVTTVHLATRVAGLTDLGSWSVDQVAALAGLTDPEESRVVTALPVLLTFLGDTERWHGAPEELDMVVHAAEHLVDPLSGVLQALDDVVVPGEVEDAALRGLPLVTRAEALLRFLLPRRRVTDTGALRRADLHAVIDLLGLETGSKPPASMWDLPALADLWEALVDAELLDITGTWVSPTPAGSAWVSGEDAGHEARRQLIDSYLLTTLLTDPPVAWLPRPLEAMLPVLASAALGRPLSTTLAIGGAPDASTLPFIPVRLLIDRLAADGLLVVGDEVAAAPGTEALLARVAGDLLADDPDDEPAALPPADPALAGRAWRLRVELEDTEPPVWREVLIDPNAPLEDLHDVVQGVFAWDDSHLHEFVASGRRRGQVTRYGPPDPFGDRGPFGGTDPFGEPAEDESAVRISQVLSRRAPLSYAYDFGDGWRHRITLRADEPAPRGLPQCTGGSGAAPVEDSGGPWGWSHQVDVANDPAHPDHIDVREWLDLDDGQTLDPSAFDPVAADRRLGSLR